MEHAPIANEAYEIGKAYKHLKKVSEIFQKLGMAEKTMDEVDRLIDVCEIKAERLGRPKGEVSV